ncbi:MAG: ABC transporter permease [Candidatus Aminicenantaceae bacterium]
MHVLWLQFISEVKVFLRYKVTVFWTFFFPLFFMVLFALLDFGGDAPLPYINYLLPAMIMMALLTTCFISTSIAFVLNREKGYYRRLFVTPLKKWTLLGGQIASRFLIILLQTVFLILVGVIFFGARMPGKNFEFWAVLVMGIFAFLSIGFFLASIVRREETVLPVSMIMFFMMLFLGGGFWPVSVMPKFLRYISKVLPSTYFNEALFKTTIESVSLGSLGLHFLVMAAWFVCFLVLAVTFFKWE